MVQDQDRMQELQDRQRQILSLVSERPSMLYRPGRQFDLDGNPIDPADNWALQMLAARHVIRLAAPGNGSGKTTLAAIEVDAWGYGDHRWSDVPIPRRPRLILWVSQKYQQFEVQKRIVEQWWPDSVRASWVGQPHCSYRWPDGSKMFVLTSESSWTSIQGVEPDLVVIDEECDAALWHELQRRRRGRIKTRYLITATATRGLTWTYSELYRPWREFHERLYGCDCGPGSPGERRAMHEQLHKFEGMDEPGIFCWPCGSHLDNPTATRESWSYYLSVGAGSEAERQVRLYGGFRDFAGTPVFSLDNLEKMRSQLERGRTGSIEVLAESHENTSAERVAVN